MTDTRIITLRQRLAAARSPEELRSVAQDALTAARMLDAERRGAPADKTVPALGTSAGKRRSSDELVREIIAKHSRPNTSGKLGEPFLSGASTPLWPLSICGRCNYVVNGETQVGHDPSVPHSYPVKAR